MKSLEQRTEYIEKRNVKVELDNSMIFFSNSYKFSKIGLYAKTTIDR